MAKGHSKLLMIFDLERTLCLTKKPALNSLKLEFNPSDSLVLRAHLNELNHFLFVRNKLFFKVGVWTSSSAETTQKLLDPVFGRFKNNLLFLYSSPKSDSQRDLQRVWYNYPDFSPSNTLMVDSQEDSTSPKENHIPLPEIKPNDQALKILQDYLKFYSYQVYCGRARHLIDFVNKIPFSLYYLEHSKPEFSDHDWENRRFG